MSLAKSFNRFVSNFKDIQDKIEIDLKMKGRMMPVNKNLKGRGKELAEKKKIIREEIDLYANYTTAIIERFFRRKAQYEEELVTFNKQRMPELKRGSDIEIQVRIRKADKQIEEIRKQIKDIEAKPKSERSMKENLALPNLPKKIQELEKLKENKNTRALQTLKKERAEIGKADGTYELATNLGKQMGLSNNEALSIVDASIGSDRIFNLDKFLEKTKEVFKNRIEGRGVTDKKVVNALTKLVDDYDVKLKIDFAHGIREFLTAGGENSLENKFRTLLSGGKDQEERVTNIIKKKFGSIDEIEDAIAGGIKGGMTKLGQQRQQEKDRQATVKTQEQLDEEAARKLANKEREAKAIAAKAKKKADAEAAATAEAEAADAEAERVRQLEEERQEREATKQSELSRAEELFNERFADPNKRPTGKDPKITGETKGVITEYNRLRDNRIRDLNFKDKQDKLDKKKADDERRRLKNERRREQKRQQKADEAQAEAEAKRQALADNRQAVVDEFNKGNNGDYDSDENKRIRGALGDGNLSFINTKEKEQAAKAMLTSYLITPKVNETDYYKEEDLERFLGTIGGVGVDKPFLRGAFGLQLDAEPDDPTQQFGQENLLHRTGDMVNRVVNRALAGEEAYRKFNNLTFTVQPEDYGPSGNLTASVFTAGRATNARRNEVPSNFGLSGFVTTPKGGAQRQIGRVRNVNFQGSRGGLAFKSRLIGVEGEGAQQGIFGQDTGLNVIAAVGTTLGSRDVRILHQTLGSQINQQGAKLNYLDPLHPAFAEVSRGTTTLGQDLTKSVSGFTKTSKVTENMADTLANLGLGGGRGRETGVPQSTGAPAGINVSLETLKDKMGDAFQRAGAVDYNTAVGVSFDPSQAANVNPRAFKGYRKASIIASPFPREPRVIRDLKKGFHLIGENDDVAVMAQQFA
jgi:hypothetical protein